MSITFHQKQQDGSIANSAVEPFQFPGGEWHLRLPEEPETTAYARVTGCDMNDLASLGLWADWVHATGQRAVAHIPYLPAARADRGTPFGARVYADLLNSLHLDEVVVFDPHSPVAPEMIANVRVVEATAVIAEQVIPHGDYAAILAPDAGAVHRAGLVAERTGLPLLTATKTRDFETGKLTGFHAPEHLPDGRILVVDDICDGGGTFMGLAQALDGKLNQLGQLDLWVSHGIFSGNAHNLRHWFDTVWTTDSHSGAFNPEVGAHLVTLDPYLA